MDKTEIDRYERLLKFHFDTYKHQGGEYHLQKVMILAGVLLNLKHGYDS